MEGNLITVEEPNYNYENSQETSSSNNEITDDIYYNLHLRVKFHFYKKITDKNGKPVEFSSTSTSSASAPGPTSSNDVRVDFEPSQVENPSLILNNVSNTQNNNLSQNYDRKLSELVKKNYLNQDLVDEIKSKTQNIVFSDSYQTNPNIINHPPNQNVIDSRYIYLDESLTDVLLQKGDLSKNRYYRDNPNNIYKPMETKAFNGEKHSINDRLKISDELVDTFHKYISLNEIILQNYSSYGDYHLMQNETEIMYQIPLNVKCIENELYNNKINKGSKDFLIRKLNLVKFYDYGKILSSWFNISNVKNYFYYDGEYNLYINPSERNHFFEEDLISVPSNIYESNEKFKVLKTKYNNFNNSQTDIDNKINTIIKMTDTIQYIQNFDKGNDRPRPADEAPSSSPNEERDTENNLISNRKLYNLYKEFYILYNYYQICADILKLISNLENENDEQKNRRNNFSNKIVSKIKEIQIHFLKRYREINNIPYSNNSRNEEQPTQQRRVQRRDMNIVESLQYYRDMIFEIFDKND